MTMRDVLMYLLFGFLVVISMQWIHQMFFARQGTNPQEPLAGQIVKAPVSEQVLKPINTEIDFFDVKPDSYKEIETSIDTQDLQVVLNSEGASLVQIYVKHHVNDTQKLIPLLEPITGLPREGRAFLVGLNEKTPYYFTLVEDITQNDTQRVTYTAQTDEAVITKTYIFYKTLCKIDLTLTIEPKEGKKIQPRVFIPAPFIEYVSPQDTVQGIFSDEYQSLKKMKPAELEGSLWIPQRKGLLFGAEDRYFIQALVADPEKFVQRGYYRLEGMRHITSVLEGPVIEESKTWTMSFYCGPKQIEAMTAVDPRLDQTLEYGWLAPISKWLLYILTLFYKWTHNYGWAIIILTVLMSLILWLFAPKKSKGGASRGMEMVKKLQYVEQKYKNDPEMLAQERNKIYEKYGSPFSGLGFLPMLIQFPVFLGLNRVLSNAIELYQAPFIKGWINDLSVKDPYYILPAIIALIMIFSTASSGDPRQRTVMVFVSIIIAGLFASFAAGLALFFCVNLLMGILKNRIQK
ncbi:MAG: membrane protein insertase YidC [Candidatus Babeliaceae bacterium]